jgi:hypothetical protein
LQKRLDKPKHIYYTSDIMKNTNKAVLAFLLAATAVTASATGHGTRTRAEYLTRLQSLEGASYSALNCSQFICAAKAHSVCGAGGFWNGCNGAVEIVKEYSDISKVKLFDLQPGDVLDFHGAHVVAYVGNGIFMDSVPERGVSAVNPYGQSNDSWYSGKVRVTRWKS